MSKETLNPRVCGYIVQWDALDYCEDWKQFGCECEKPTCERGCLLVKFVLGFIDASAHGMTRALCSCPIEILFLMFNAVLICSAAQSIQPQ